MLVKDLFLCRSLNTSGNSDTVFHDIETQREVTASMLLRLIHHTKVRRLRPVFSRLENHYSRFLFKALARFIDLIDTDNLFSFFSHYAI